MPISLTDRVIVITGASSGIGAAAAVACAAAGMHVVLAARRVDKLHAVAQQVRNHNRRALVVSCDVARDQDVANLADAATRQFGRIDVMFANAGYGLYASIADTTDRQMRDIFETNYYGTLRCVKAAIPIMRKQGTGHIVIMTSAASEVGPPMYGAYAATKAAQDAVASALRAELHHENIHVTSVHPIGTKTEFTDRVRELSVNYAAGQNTPRVIQQSSEHVANCIIRCLRKPRAEVWPHFLTRLGVGIAAAFPALPAWALRKRMKRLLHSQQSTHQR